MEKYYLDDLNEKIELFRNDDLINKDIFEFCKKYNNRDFYNNLMEIDRLNLNEYFYNFDFYDLNLKEIKDEFKKDNYNSVNSYKLGMIYNYNYEYKNIKKAIKYFSLSTSLPMGCFELGKINHINKNYEVSIKLYEKGLKNNIIETKNRDSIIYCLGFLYQQLRDYNNMLLYYNLDMIREINYNYPLTIYDNKFNSLLNLGAYYQFITKEYNSMKIIYDFILSFDENKFYSSKLSYIYKNTLFFYGLYYENIDINISISFYNNILDNKEFMKTDYYSVIKKIIYLERGVLSKKRYEDFYNSINNIYLSMFNIEYYVKIKEFEIVNMLFKFLFKSKFNKGIYKINYYILYGFFLLSINKINESKFYLDLAIEFSKKINYIYGENIDNINVIISNNNNFIDTIKIDKKIYIDFINIIKIILLS